MRDIFLYDDIGPAAYGMLDAKWMSDELKAANGQDVRLRINSGGGSVFEAQAMYTLLKAHSGKVTAHVDSLAASAASFVMLGASTIAIAENAYIMIHNAWGMAIGSADDMRKTADLLDKVTNGSIDQYAAKTGQSVAQLKQWLDDETWMTATEAKDRGFVDEITPTLKVKACVRDGQFQHTPAHLLASATHVSPAVQAAAMRRRLALATASLDIVR